MMHTNKELFKNSDSLIVISFITIRYPFNKCIPFQFLVPSHIIYFELAVLLIFII